MAWYWEFSIILLWIMLCPHIDFLLYLFQSYNPMSEPFDNWENKFDTSPEQSSHEPMEFGELAKHAESSITENDFTFPVEGSCEDDDVLTESKIKAFLEEKVTSIY
jgi:mitogen-activated protein kinase kinase kinase ANP1